MRGALEKEAGPATDAWPPSRGILYDVDVTGTHAGDGLLLEVLLRDRKLDGAWSKPKVRPVSLTWKKLVPLPPQQGHLY